MNNIFFACVYRSTSDEPVSISSDWDELKIAGKDVGFLVDILRNQSTLNDVTESVWRLDFFENSVFRQIFYISVVQVVPAKGEIDHYTRKDIAEELKKEAYKQVLPYVENPREVVKGTFIQTSQYEPSENVILMASQLIRGTNSMRFDKDKLEQHSDRFIHVDGRGTVLMSPNKFHFSTFKRQLMLLTLSKAYLLAMNEIMNGLAEHCENNEELKNLYKNSLLFNAKYFFANPVKVNRYDAFQLWQGIRKCMMIDDINNEVLQQLKAVHQILNEEEDAKQLKSELRLNKRIAWLSIAIGVFSLVSLFEITPQKISDFTSSWWRFIFS